MTPGRRQPTSNARRREGGAALVEFALVLPVLLVLALGMVDFGKAFNYWIDETHLAAEGARWAVVNKNPGSGDGLTLQQYVQQQGTTSELRDGGTASIATPMQICITFLTDSDDGTSGQVGDPVQVTASATYTWLPFLQAELDVLDTTITASATMRLEAVPSNYSAGCSSSGGT